MPAAPSPHEIAFTIDGESFTTTDAAQTAGELLSRYAHMDPSAYELGELDGKDPTPRVYSADETVHLHPGARYISLRIGPGPVE
jgi:hypothetical protein